MNEPYLVTGCAGFIGAKVCELLLQAGHEVVGIDSLNDAYDPRLKQWRLAQLQALPRFAFRQLDISDFSALEASFTSDLKQATAGGVERPYAAVINLAARAGVRPSVENPWIYFQTNTLGSLNLLELCRRHGVKKFVLASTSSLYGSNSPTPFREDANTDRPLSPYAATKKAAETLAYTYHHLHGIDVSVLRYFTVYGPAGRPDMSVFRFIRKIASGETLTVFGDGRQQRDFTFVDDIARGTLASLRPLGYEIVNLGSDRPIVLAEMIEILGEMLIEAPRIEYLPPHAADPLVTWASIEKAQRLLQWQPQTNFRQGLEAAVRWFRDHRDLALDIRLD